MAFTDLDEFELARKRAERESKVRLQTRQDALQRRFASLGNLDSGIQLKQASLAEQEEGQALADVKEGIGTAERMELRRRRELAEQRQYQTSERLGSQLFASGETALGRRFATGERVGSEKFASGEARTGREFGAAQANIAQRFATGERRESENFASRERGLGQAFASQETAKAQSQQASQFARQLDLTKKHFAQQLDLTKKQFDVSIDQFDRTFGEEVRINNKNIEFAEQVLGEKDLIDQISSPFQKLGSFVERGIIRPVSNFFERIL